MITIMIASTASLREKSQTTEPQSGSSASRRTPANTSKKSSSTNPTQGHQTASKSQEKPSASTKVGEAGTSKAKKRPSDASGPSATKVHTSFRTRYKN